MERSPGSIDFFSILFGFLLLIQGIWNLIDPPLLGVFTSNPLHATIHVLLGIAGIWTGFKSGAKIFLLFLGFLLLSVGSLFFVAGAQELLIEIFNVNIAVALLNIVIGVLALLVVLISGKKSARA